MSARGIVIRPFSGSSAHGGLSSEINGVRLGPREADIIFILLGGRITSEPEIADAICRAGGAPEGFGTKVITQLVCRLRRKLAPVGLTIKAHGFRGYQLAWSDA